MVLVGGQVADRVAVEAAGLRACELVLPEDRWGFAAAATRGEVYADRVAGAVWEAVERQRAVAAWGVGGFGVAVAGAGVPHVLRSPPTRPQDLDRARDPAWAHVPGLWWGGAAELQSGALSVGDDPVALAAALKAEVRR